MPKYLRLLSHLTENRPLKRLLALDSIKQSTLEPEALLARAAKRTGLGHWGEPHPAKPFEALLGSVLESPDLSLIGAISHRTNLTRALSNRLYLNEALARHPEIEQERIKAPLLISGIARSGTTYLHERLSRHPRARSPKTFEVLFSRDPRRLGNIDERIGKTRSFLRTLRWCAPQVTRMHRMAWNSSEECYFWLEPSALSWQYPMTGELPGYQRWLEGQSLRPAYSQYAQQLRYLQWQGEAGWNSESSFWCLKSPFHLFGLEELIQQFPDIRIVVIHRNPIETMASWLTLVGVVRHIHQHSVCYRTIGQDALEYWRIALDRMMRVSQKNPDNFVHAGYQSLMDDPDALVARIYERIGREADLAGQAAAPKAARQPKRIMDKYDIGWYGLSEEAINHELSDYIDFCRDADMA